jgi:chemotaxis protein MotB
MSTSRILVAGLFAAASFSFTGCGDRELNYKKVEIEELKRQVRDLDAELAACEMRSTSTVLANSPSHGHDEGDQGDAIGHGTHVGHRDQETYISVPGSVLFKPGSAKLTTEAKATLSRIIEVIHEQYAGKHVRVDGFTDNEPVTRSKDKWDDNFDLSGGRALSVLHFLEAHGIEKKDLGFAGFGEERAKASNVTESNRAKNRRVEIVVSQNSDVMDSTYDDSSDDTTPAPKKSTHHKKKSAAASSSSSTAPATNE